MACRSRGMGPEVPSGRVVKRFKRFLCDWGFRGCDMHIESGWFTPNWLVRMFGFYRDYEPID